MPLDQERRRLLQAGGGRADCGEAALALARSMRFRWTTTCVTFVDTALEQPWTCA